MDSGGMREIWTVGGWGKYGQWGDEGNMDSGGMRELWTAD